MQADRDDAPLRRKAGAKPGAVGRWVLALITSLGVTGIALHFAAGSFSGLQYRTAPDSSTPQAESALPQNTATPAPALARAQLPQPQRAGTLEPPSTPERQTDFNDGNYTPRGAVNIVSYGSQPQPAHRVSPQDEGLTVSGIKEDSRLRDHCPYKPGSVEHRNCRQRIGLEHRRGLNN